MTLQQNIINNLHQLLTKDFSSVVDNRSGQVELFKKGAVIYHVGETISNLFFVESGDVKVVDYQNSNNVPYIKWFNYKGSLIDLIGLLGRDKYLDTAIAMTDVKLRVWNKEEIKKISKMDVAFNAYIFQEILNKNVALEQRISSRFTLTSRQRVINMLIELINEKGIRIGFDTLVRSSMTHQEIANYTNTSRQTVTGVLKELKKRNLLIFDRRRILFRDVDKLKALLSEKKND